VLGSLSMKMHPHVAIWYQQTVKLLQDKWQTLNDRDRIALKALSIFFGLLICWLFITAVFDWKQHRQSAYEETRALLTWMHTQEPLARQAAQLSSNASSSTAQSLLATINAIAQTHNIAVKRIEPDGEHDVRLWLENIAYHDMVLWLFELEKQKNIHIKQITINTQGASGYVSGTIIFGS
jgi:general secretion pathway protein M